nr:YqjK family protein [Variovorax boronicumulans]
MRRRKSLAELERERGRLLERISVQRSQLPADFALVAQLLQFGERVAMTIQAARSFVQRHPWALGAIGAVMVLRRPRSLGRWLKRGLLVWRTWRTARNFAQVIQRQLNRPPG